MARYLLLLVSLVSLVSLHETSSPPPPHPCLPKQKTPLLRLKHQLLQSIFCDWSTSDPRMLLWHEDTNCCYWDGVSCDDSSGVVIGLDLSFSCLNGSLESYSSLFELHSLKRLNLSFNPLRISAFPPEFGQLQMLTHLDVSYTFLAGRIPLELARLNKLVSLRISHIYRGGLYWNGSDFKAFIQNATGLSQLQLWNVQISSTPLECLVNLSSLSSLSLDMCKLEGVFPEAMFSLPKIKSISLDRNPNLSVPLPTFLPNSSLEYLSLSYTNISTVLTDSIGNLKDLTYLDLHGCYLQGNIPSSLGNLSQLTYLDLSDNLLHGSLPSSLENSSRLEYLDIHQTSHPCLPHQKTALLRLKHQLFSHDYCRWSVSYPKMQSWDEDPNCCFWDGVSCDDASGMVIGLDLSSACLRGTLDSHSSLFDLHNLKSLNLSYNDLTSYTIPQEFGKLQMLTELNLVHSGLQGDIPLELARLNKLQYLNIYSQEDGGVYWRGSNFKAFVQNVTGLTRLELWNVRISSARLDFLVNLSSLSSLSLDTCRLEGKFPEAMFSLPNIKSISLYNNPNLSVGLPEFLPDSSIEHLDFSYMNISTVLPDSIGNLKRLRSLHLRGCNIQGNIPSLGNLSQLALLDLSRNSLHGSLPSSLGNLSRLRYLYLNRNSFHGVIPSSLFTNTSINFLDLSQNQFNGFEDFSTIYPPQSIKYLFASGNNFSGELFRAICNLISLQVLDLSDNDFVGTIPQCFHNLSSTSLSTLYLQRNRLNRIPPQIFANAKNLISINLEQNHLSGRLPRTLSQCEKLEVLNVGNNMIRDAFPWWLSDLGRLQVLVLRRNEFNGLISSFRPAFLSLRVIDISQNYFVGSVPSEFFSNWKVMAKAELKPFNSTRPEDVQRRKGYYDDSITFFSKGVNVDLRRIFNTFTAIDFSSNNFEGSLPVSIGELRSLRMLNFSNNFFGGYIPSSLANLKNLESLDLSGNKLSGKIPVELGVVSTLAVMNFSNNQLEGLIPQTAQFSTQNPSSFERNKGLCGLPLDECGDGNGDAMDQKPSKDGGFIQWAAVIIGYAPGLLVGVVIGHFITRGKFFL